ncbi:hypothetical protein BAUCODRAFT_507579 [Baudoinia panamericana UAMH 10762]|uniref:F-box domain-containing protein n=1 Tax=Baudoinia panamericana (strain UAMH 10762) TaxID=717646 RepID=M2NAL1_BAUPA|nr:uncharacterized protein BAUCODRAFT_507579 [Baudoinia panamericana UAMH 10762]EMC95885.1 hypothetical protein BAUCODRAFT_507579 [Baudoinia panamericana UAMH 10762]
MAKLQFGDLPEDIKALVVEHILRPTDLKNICLVNKQLHGLAVKELYRKVDLDLGSRNDTHLSAFLNPNNKGLKHIKQIRLHRANIHDRRNTQLINFATRMLVEFLPEDVLEEFSWCPWERFSADNMLLLYKKQRKMKWLEAFDLDRDILPELKKNTKLQDGVFSCVRKLALYPENQATLQLCHFFVEKISDVLEEMMIQADFEPHDQIPTLSLRDINDTATGPGLLSRTIFSHMLPFEQCTPFRSLTALRLHQISLRHSADTWCRIVKFTEIQTLELTSCIGADTLLGQLSKASNLPRQLKTLEIQHKDNTEHEALVALDGFLCLVSGITELTLELENVKALPAAAGIMRHSKTLKLLNVHCTPEYSAITSPSTEVDEVIWSTEEFEDICKACTKLEQLSCAWPDTSLIRDPSEAWRAYENAVFSHLNQLVTLHVSTFPTNQPSSQLLPKSVYECLLQHLTKRMFELAVTWGAKARSSTNSHSHLSATDATNDVAAETDSDQMPSESTTTLRLIAFGISDKIYEREDSKHQAIYLRSTCISALGKEHVYAAPIGWCMRNYVEPRSDVLDFTLHRVTRMPYKERDNHDYFGETGE